jgi:uncharacterized surface protein with fasciclin (FAS1) repeats
MIMTVLKRYAALAITAIAIAFTGHAQAAHHEGGHAQKGNIVEVAAGNDDFSTLVAAVKAAGLVEVLAGDGPYTVFAPTNAAFAKLPAGTVESLLEPENRDQLIAILKYHVVPGKVMAADVVGLDSATTAQGSDISIAASDAGVTVDNANVIMTDVEASNGVIHVIDAVILPKA